ncbi:MAG: sigma-70 family RNA polymerase sigma factor [Clostridiales bacterium]|jgi:RNA polymerase sigma-70 factor (ECF subfamily)|nr:sigma-70 family RNA polymerase sigma factor [Clostridiales bacterium]
MKEVVCDVLDLFLLRSIRAGNELALERIIDKYTAYVCVIIRNAVCGSLTHEDIEEVASDVFCALWDNAEAIRNENLKAYLGGIARNKAKNKLRGITECMPLSEELIEAGDNPETLAISADVQITVRSAVLTLQETDRDIFLRHYYGSQTVAAISAETGISESAIKHRLIRRREILGKEVFSL